MCAHQKPNKINQLTVQNARAVPRKSRGTAGAQKKVVRDRVYPLSIFNSIWAATGFVGSKEDSKAGRYRLSFNLYLNLTSHPMSWFLTFENAGGSTMQRDLHEFKNDKFSPRMCTDKII